MERFTKALSLVGTAALVVGVLLTMLDIGLRSVSTLTVRGIVDIMQLCVLVGAMLAIPHGFVADQHVAIDVFAERMPVKMQVALRVFASALAALFLAGVFWFSLQQAITESAGGDRSQTIGIPMIWYWMPFLAGIALSVVASLFVMVRLLRDGLPTKVQ
jgi:TRAP-type C4-dicarboxylate transport system permease small subunit